MKTRYYIRYRQGRQPTDPTQRPGAAVMQGPYDTYDDAATARIKLAAQKDSHAREIVCRQVNEDPSS